MSNTKTSTALIRKRICTLAFNRVVKQETTDKQRAEYRELVAKLAAKTKARPGTIRLAARRAAYARAAH